MEMFHWPNYTTCYLCLLLCNWRTRDFLHELVETKTRAKKEWILDLDLPGCNKHNSNWMIMLLNIYLMCKKRHFLHSGLWLGLTYQLNEWYSTLLPYAQGANWTFQVQLTDIQFWLALVRSVLCCICGTQPCHSVRHVIPARQEVWLLDVSKYVSSPTLGCKSRLLLKH